MGSEALNPRPRRSIVPSIVLALWLSAMLAYPGWSSLDPHSDGFDPRKNFVCHLLTPRTANGVDNTVSASLMLCAAALLVGGKLLPMWWHATDSVVWLRICRTLGVVATVLLATLCAELAFDLRLEHGLVAIGAGAAGLLPTAVFGLKEWRLSERLQLRHVFALIAVLAGAVNLVGYLRVEFGYPLTMVVPTAQNLALASLLGWLALVDSGTHAST